MVDSKILNGYSREFDPYKAIGIPVASISSASDRDVTVAFNKFAKKCHPNKWPSLAGAARKNAEKEWAYGDRARQVLATSSDRKDWARFVRSEKAEDEAPRGRGTTLAQRRYNRPDVSPAGDRITGDTYVVTDDRLGDASASQAAAPKSDYDPTDARSSRPRDPPPFDKANSRHVMGGSIKIIADDGAPSRSSGLPQQAADRSAGAYDRATEVPRSTPQRGDSNGNQPQNAPDSRHYSASAQYVPQTASFNRGAPPRDARPVRRETAPANRGYGEAVKRFNLIDANNRVITTLTENDLRRRHIDPQRPFECVRKVYNGLDQHVLIQTQKQTPRELHIVEAGLGY